MAVNLIIVCTKFGRPPCRIHTVDHTLAQGWIEESNLTDYTNSLGLAHYFGRFTQHATRSNRNVETAHLCEQYQFGAFIVSIPSGFSE